MYYYYANSAKKKLYCIANQHGRLVAWVKTNNNNFFAAMQLQFNKNVLSCFFPYHNFEDFTLHGLRDLSYYNTAAIFVEQGNIPDIG